MANTYMSLFAVLFLVSMFGLGYIYGKYEGYLDAQPKRDKRGRFAKRK